MPSEKLEVGNPVLSAKNIIKHFPVGGLKRGRYVHATDAVSLDLYAGHVVALVGESGSGKSTIDLSEDASIETAIVMGEVYRTGNEWKFLPVGAGYQGGLAALASGFGVNI